MTALNFPGNPNLNQIHTENGYSWQWDGISWISYTTLPHGPTGPTGPTGPSGAGSNLTLINDTSSVGPYYLTMANASSGTWSVPYVSATQLYFNPNTGTLNATIFETLSDITLKENIKTLKNGRKIVDLFEPIEFTWKQNGRKSYGLSAQQVETIIPELVSDNYNSGILTLNYDGIIPFLISAVQELSKKEKELMKIIKNLTNRIDKLESYER